MPQSKMLYIKKGGYIMEKTTMIDGKQFFAIAFLYIMCNDLIRGHYLVRLNKTSG